ncbi:SH3 domain-containing protein [Leptospira fluminis]|uniref:SH3 domain-containing protein n=1 Tax=Leptospira fluminis TaxID=2484979 RepID=A0A4R9GTB0_9LEPT|nr:SH3 domain-containing protein [Leptospira fluminis]TGK20840.1 SH3 domain-containing protein [Leptospira fluminis]
MKSVFQRLGLFFFICIFPPLWSQGTDGIRYVLITSGVLNVRETPDTGKVLFTLNKGARVRLAKDDGGDWVKIKLEDGRNGFVSRRYLGSTPPETLDAYKLIGLVWSGYDPKELPVMVPLAFFGKNGWQEAKDEFEFDYKFRSGVEKGLPSVTLLQGNKGPMFSAVSSGTYGCQEFPALKVKPSAELDSKFSYLVHSPELGLHSLTLRELAPSESEYELFKSLAETTWKARGFKETEWLRSKLQEVYEFKTPKKETFISGRIAFSEGNAERRYFYLLARKSGTDRALIAFEKSDTLSPEIGVYGGSFHLIGSVYREDDPAPILIFTDIGYDSSIRSLYELRNGTLRLLLRGGGDAC